MSSERYSLIKTHPQFQLIVDTYDRYKKIHSKKKINDLLRSNYNIDLNYTIFAQWSDEYDKDYDLGAVFSRMKKESDQQKDGVLMPGSSILEKGRKDIVYFAEEVLKLELHPGQKQWLRESTEEGRMKNILVPSNQWGKTTCTAIKHIWMCFYKIGLPEEVIDRASYETLAISPKLRQVRAFYQYVLDVLQGNIWWTRDKYGRRKKQEVFTNEGCLIKDFLIKPKNVPTTQQISQTPILFANGSKIHTASTGGDMGSGLAGGQFTFISYDECPLSLNLEEELPTRIQSRLIKFGGGLDLIGTPDVDCDSFMYYQRLVQTAMNGKDGWYVQFGILDDNIFIAKKNRDAIKKAILTTNPQKYRQVVFGDFVRGGSSVFSPEVVARMFVDTMEAVPRPPGGMEIEPPKDNGTYVIGVDWALAGDYTVMVVLEYSQEIWKIVYFYRIRGLEKAPQQQYMDLLELKHRYHADVMMDTNGLGGKLIQSEFKDEPGMEGFGFGPGKKTGLIATLKKAMYWNNEQGRIRTAVLPDLEEELGAYKIDDKKIRQDTVMALALACWKADQYEALPEVADFSF